MRNLAFVSIQFAFGRSHAGLGNKLESLLLVIENGQGRFSTMINSRSLKHLSRYLPSRLHIDNLKAPHRPENLLTGSERERIAEINLLKDIETAVEADPPTRIGHDVSGMKLTAGIEFPRQCYARTGCRFSD